MRLDNRTVYDSKQLTKLIQFVYEEVRNSIRLDLPGWRKLRIRVLYDSVWRNPELRGRNTYWSTDVLYRDEGHDSFVLKVFPPIDIVESVTMQLQGKQIETPYDYTARLAKLLVGSLIGCYPLRLVSRAKINLLEIKLDERAEALCGPYLLPKAKR